MSVQINDIDLTDGAYVSKLVAGRFNYNFNTRMFLNALIQYSTDTGQVSSNIRFNFIHRPLERHLPRLQRAALRDDRRSHRPRDHRQGHLHDAVLGAAPPPVKDTNLTTKTRRHEEDGDRRRPMPAAQ